MTGLWQRLIDGAALLVAVALLAWGVIGCEAESPPTEPPGGLAAVEPASQVDTSWLPARDQNHLLPTILALGDGRHQLEKCTAAEAPGAFLCPKAALTSESPWILGRPPGRPNSTETSQQPGDPLAVDLRVVLLRLYAVESRSRDQVVLPGSRLVIGRGLQAEDLKRALTSQLRRLNPRPVALVLEAAGDDALKCLGLRWNLQPNGFTVKSPQVEVSLVDDTTSLQSLTSQFPVGDNATVLRLDQAWLEIGFPEEGPGQPFAPAALIEFEDPLTGARTFAAAPSARAGHQIVCSEDPCRIPPRTAPSAFDSACFSETQLEGP